ncbi:MAG TPA: DoxX family protein [Candidatus Nanoarchaeia archaeon]|nr:DoxX family protein [Candidatus Nanoarchaeia archaeon]
MAYFETKYRDYLYVIFRIGIGALFFMYGVQKLFGLWGMPGGPAAFGTLVWYAGAAELLIGLALIAGVLTRLASFFGVIEMIVAYSIGHALPGGWNPAVNQGAPALLFMLAFLVTLAYGARKASFEQAVLGKELF